MELKNEAIEKISDFVEDVSDSLDNIIEDEMEVKPSSKVNRDIVDILMKVELESDPKMVGLIKEENKEINRFVNDINNEVNHVVIEDLENKPSDEFRDEIVNILEENLEEKLDSNVLDNIKLRESES